MKRPIRPTHGDDNNYNRVLDRTHDILNGGISMGDFGPNGVNNGFVSGSNTRSGNLNCVIVQVQADAVAGNTFAATHNLGTVPVGFIVINRNNNGNIFMDFGIPATTKTMNFKCDVAGTQFTLMIF